MSSYSETVLDANVLMRAVDGTATEAIRELWRDWMRDRVVLHAPTLMHYEIVNGMHRMRQAGRLKGSDAVDAVRSALGRPIVMHSDAGLHFRALQLADEHGLPATYDAHYLALAERLSVELWTADAKLANAVGDRLPWVRLVS